MQNVLAIFTQVNNQPNSMIERVGDWLITPLAYMIGHKQISVIQKDSGSKRMLFSAPVFGDPLSRYNFLIRGVAKSVCLTMTPLALVGGTFKTLALITSSQTRNFYINWKPPIYPVINNPRTMEDLGENTLQLFREAKKAGLVFQLLLRIHKEPRNYLVSLNDPMFGGHQVHLPPYLSECACVNSNNFARMHNHRRQKIELEMTELVIKNFSTDAELRYLSLGAGELLQDFFNISLLMQAGYTSIQVTLVDPSFFSPTKRMWGPFEDVLDGQDEKVIADWKQKIAEAFENWDGKESQVETLQLLFTQLLKKYNGNWDYFNSMYQECSESEEYYRKKIAQFEFLLWAAKEKGVDLQIHYLQSIEDYKDEPLHLISAVDFDDFNKAFDDIMATQKCLDRNGAMFLSYDVYNWTFGKTALISKKIHGANSKTWNEIESAILEDLETVKLEKTLSLAFLSTEVNLPKWTVLLPKIAKKCGVNNINLTMIHPPKRNYFGHPNGPSEEFTEENVAQFLNLFVPAWVKISVQFIDDLDVELEEESFDVVTYLFKAGKEEAVRKNVETIRQNFPATLFYFAVEGYSDDRMKTYGGVFSINETLQWIGEKPSEEFQVKILEDTKAK